MSSGYRPEIDTTPPLDAQKANYFEGLIGILGWICELGRIDIIVDVAMLPQFLAPLGRDIWSKCSIYILF